MTKKPTRRRDPLAGYRDQRQQDDEDGASAKLLPEEYQRAYILDSSFAVIEGLKNLDSALRAVLDQAKDEARQAVSDLVACDPSDAEMVRQLQWKVTRFDDLVRFVFLTLQAGETVRADMSEEEIAAVEAELRRQGKGD